MIARSWYNGYRSKVLPLLDHSIQNFGTTLQVGDLGKLWAEVDVWHVSDAWNFVYRRVTSKCFQERKKKMPTDNVMSSGLQRYDALPEFSK